VQFGHVLEIVLVVARIGNHHAVALDEDDIAGAADMDVFDNIRQHLERNVHPHAAGGLALLQDDLGHAHHGLAGGGHVGLGNRRFLRGGHGLAIPGPLARIIPGGHLLGFHARGEAALLGAVIDLHIGRMAGLHPLEQGADLAADGVVRPGHGLGLGGRAEIAGQRRVHLGQKRVRRQLRRVLLGVVHENGHGVVELPDLPPDGVGVQGQGVAVHAVEDDAEDQGDRYGDDKKRDEKDFELDGFHRRLPHAWRYTTRRSCRRTARPPRFPCVPGRKWKSPAMQCGPHGVRFDFANLEKKTPGRNSGELLSHKCIAETRFFAKRSVYASPATQRSHRLFFTGRGSGHRSRRVPNRAGPTNRRDGSCRD